MATETTLREAVEAFARHGEKQAAADDEAERLQAIATIARRKA